MSNDIFYIVGPSGCGKTTTCELLYKCSNMINYYNLDSIVGLICKKHRDDFEDFGYLSKHLSILIENFINNFGNNKKSIIDVGAGSLESRSFRGFLSCRRGNIISITADRKECYKRIKESRNDCRIFEKYREDEFRPEREEIYNYGKKIDTTGRDINYSVTKLAEEIGLQYTHN